MTDPAEGEPKGAEAVSEPIGAALAGRDRRSFPTGLDPRGWRTTIAVAVIMVGAVGGANLANAAVPLPAEPAGAVEPGPGVPGAPATDPGEPTPAEPGPVSAGGRVEVGSGLVLHPPDGWTVVGSEDGQVVLQKASAVVFAAAGPFEGDPDELATEYGDAFLATGQLAAGDRRSVDIDDAIPAVAFPYTGVAEGAQVDGVIVAGVDRGIGIVLNFVAAQGGLPAISDDIDVFAGSLELEAGPQ